jgi:nicotinic acid mononucleotide adenylyltransferase
LELGLSRYEAQLADWVTCPSGKSPEGKKKIADLQQKVDSTKDAIKQIETRRSDQRVSAPSTVTAATLAQAVGRSPRFAGLDVYA